MARSYKKEMYEMIYGSRKFSQKDIDDGLKRMAAELTGSHADIVPEELEKVNALIRQMIVEEKKRLGNS